MALALTPSPSGSGILVKKRWTGGCATSFACTFGAFVSVSLSSFQRSLTSLWFVVRIPAGLQRGEETQRRVNNTDGPAGHTTWGLGTPDSCTLAMAERRT